jgi:hypothetical protein
MMLLKCALLVQANLTVNPDEVNHNQELPGLSSKQTMGLPFSGSVCTLFWFNLSTSRQSVYTRFSCTWCCHTYLCTLELMQRVIAQL